MSSEIWKWLAGIRRCHDHDRSRPNHPVTCLRKKLIDRQRCPIPARNVTTSLVQNSVCKLLSRIRPMTTLVRGEKAVPLFGINEGLAPFCRIIQRRVQQFTSGHRQPLKQKWGKSFIFKPASAEIRLAPRLVEWWRIDCRRWRQFLGIRDLSSRFIVPAGAATPWAKQSLLKNRL